MNTNDNEQGIDLRDHIKDHIDKLFSENATPIERYQMLGYNFEDVWESFLYLCKLKLPSFELEEGQHFAYENAVRWLIADPTMKAQDPQTGQYVWGDLTRGLYISGETGRGKTFLLERLRDLSQALKVKYAYNDGGEYVPNAHLLWKIHQAEDIVQAFASGEAKLMKDLKDARILCINDLGREPKEALHMGNRQNVLKQMLEARGDKGYTMTLITSNIPMRSITIRGLYGERVQSRLCGMCNYLEVYGSDHRMRANQ